MHNFHNVTGHFTSQYVHYLLCFAVKLLRDE